MNQMWRAKKSGLINEPSKSTLKNNTLTMSLHKASICCGNKLSKLPVNSQTNAMI